MQKNNPGSLTGEQQLQRERKKERRRRRYQKRMELVKRTLKPLYKKIQELQFENRRLQEEVEDLRSVLNEADEKEVQDESVQ